MSASISRLGAIKAALIMTFSTYVTVALGLVVSALLARQLGPNDYGRYAYVLWMVGVLVTIGNHGIPVTATRYISHALGAGNHHGAAAVYGWLQRAQWVSLAVVSGLFLLSSNQFQPVGWTEDHTLFLSVSLVCFLPKAVYQFHSSAAKGHWQFWAEASGNMITSVVYTLGVGVLTLMHASLTTNLYWFCAVSMMHLGIVWWFRRKANMQINHGPLPDDARATLRGTMWWTSTQVMVSAFGAKTVDVYLLSRLLGTAEVGYYTLATNLARGAIEMLSSSLSTLLMPTLSHARGQGGYDQVKPILSDANRYFLFLGVSLAGMGVLWAHPAVTLIYGHRYEVLIPVLQWMVIIGGPAMLDSPVASLLLIVDDQRVRTLRAVSIMVLGASASIILIPQMGLMGAVVASAINAAVIYLVFGFYVYRQIGFQMPWRAMFNILLAGALAAGLAWGLVWLHDTSWVQWVSGGLFFVVFCALTMVLNVWTPRDLQLLITMLSRKPALFGRAIAFLQRRLHRQTIAEA